MLRSTLLFIFSFAVIHSSIAQNAVAKIKYEDAEEAFEKKDYDKTIQLLDEAKNLLGETNPRILYLRIIAQKEIIVNNRFFNYSVIESLKADADFYLKNYESSDEDKYRQVYKASELVSKTYPDKTTFRSIMDQRLAEDRKISDANEKKSQALKELNALATKYKFVSGRTIEQYSAANSDFREFMSKAKRTVTGELVNYNDKFNALAANPFKIGINSVTTKNGVVISITYILNSVKKKEDDDLMAQYAEWRNWSIRTFGATAIQDKPYLGNGQFRVSINESNFYYEVMHYPLDIDFKWNCLMLVVADNK